MRKDVKNSHAQANIFSRAQKSFLCMQKSLRENQCKKKTEKKYKIFTDD